MIRGLDDRVVEPLRHFYNGANSHGIVGSSCRVSVLGGMTFVGTIVDPIMDRRRESVRFRVACQNGQVHQLEWLARSGTVVVVDSTTGLTNQHVITLEVG